MTKPLQCDLTGQRFGKLTVIEYIGGSKEKRGAWRCICDCGKECFRETYRLTSGKSVSCGCTYMKAKNKKASNCSNTKVYSVPKASLCFSCIRSAAPPSLQCIWDASKATILPEGAVAETHILSERIPVKKILSCPLYLSMNDPENMDMLLKARGRNREQVEKEKLLNERCAILDDNDFDGYKE